MLADIVEISRIRSAGAPRTFLPVFLLTITLFTACCGPEIVITPDIDPITTEYIIGELTKSKYRGRLAGAPGNEAAGEFLQGLYKRIGLAPLIKSTYRWEYMQTVYDPDLSDPQLSIHFADGTKRELAHGREFTLNMAAGDIGIHYQVSSDSSIPHFIHSADVLHLHTFIGFPAALTRTQTSQSLSISVLNETLNGILWSNVEKVSFTMNNSAREEFLYNVIGLISGRDNTSAIIVGAHYDGVGYAGEYFSPGALDNASGVAAMVRIAGIIAAWGELPEVDIIFAAFNGEESGLWGSNAFVEEFVALGRYNRLFYINIDCIGSINELPVAAYTPHNINPPLTQFLDEWGISYIHDAHYHGGSSDDISFNARNIPYITLTPSSGDALLAHIHHGGDTKESLNYSLIDDIAAMTAEYIKAVGANLPVWELRKKMVSVEGYLIRRGGR